MDKFLQTVQNAIWNMFNRPKFIDFLDILMVAIIVYQIILLLKETRASALIKGIIILLIAWLASDILGLTSLNWLLLTVINNGVLVLIILFQPELRKILEQLGRGAFRDITKRVETESNIFIIEQIVNATLNLSRRRVGALIVFEQSIGIKDVVETGTSLDSEISSQLLENIFEPNTPLHDGAVVIRGNRIMAAACILSLTQNNKLSQELGTRHRAAIGITETSDAISLIVSEETGTISMAENGKLRRHLDRNDLYNGLEKIYSKKEDSIFKTTFKKIFKRKKNESN